MPGLLSFREGPALLTALATLTASPDVIRFDPHGLAHPRRFALACHLGVLLNCPAVGCAKSVLVGDWDPAAQGDRSGSWVPLTEGGETLGAAVRTRDGARPIVLSIGHRVSLRSAMRRVLACCVGYRILAPARQADIAVARVKRGMGLPSPDDCR